MKKNLARTLCLLCSLAVLFSSAGVIPKTAASEADATESGDMNLEYDPERGDGGGGDSGIFVITGMDDSLGSAPVSGESNSVSIPEETGRDVESLNAAFADSRSAPDTWQDDDTLGSSVIAPDAPPSVTVSQSDASLKAGETASVIVTISGYPAGSYLQSANGNFNAFSCVWGDWSGTSIPLRITGKDSGSGAITLRLKDSGNKELASATVSVTVVRSVPTLTAEPASVDLDAGESGAVTLNVKNYSGGGSVSATVSDASVCDATIGSWSGWTIPVTVRAKSAGSAKITVTLYNSVRTPMASVTFAAVVSDKASLSVSPESPSLYAGESALLTVSASGAVSDGDYLEYSVSNSTAFSAAWFGAWSGQEAQLNLAGKNAGSGTLTVTMKNRAGTTLDKKSVPVTVSVRSAPKVSVSPSSVSVEAGASANVRCAGQNISEAFCLRYINNNPSLFKCAWQSSWSGNAISLTITGKAAGFGAITVELITGSTVRASADIQVTVTAPDNGGGNGGSSGGGDDGNNGGNGGGGDNSGKSPSYAFNNYSKPGIALALCQHMFGNTQRAKTVYDWDIGNGGVCFGMSATSALLSSPNQPNPDAFGKSLISKLQKSDYSSQLGLSLSDFIEAMHITQVSSAMRESSGVSAMVDAVRNGGASQPTIICMRGAEGGHAILSYGLTSNGSLRIYDSNWPGQERTLSINGDAWSYQMWEGLTWGSNNARISYIPYSVYSAIWGNRGALNGARLQDGGVLNGEDGSQCLLVTAADDFTLLAYDDYFEQYAIAEYENGVLTQKADNVQEVFLDSVLLEDENPVHLHMLYVPADFYAIQNRSGKMDVALSGLDLSIRVVSEAEEFDLAVSDDENYANAILSLTEGEEYSISVGSSREGEPDETTIEGVGNGQTISLGMGGEGLYISNGADSVLSLGELEDGQEGSFKQDFALNSKEFDREFQLTAAAGKGGSISPEGAATVLEGASQTYRILPDAGYTLKAVYVNGVAAAYSDEGYSYCDGAYEYTFRDVEEQGYLYAEFAKDISACRVHADYDSGELTVTVTDFEREDGEQELVEGEDYIWSMLTAANGDGEPETYLAVQALSGSDYSGVKMEPYTFHTESDELPKLLNGSYDREGKEIRLTAVNADALPIVAAAYVPEFDGSRTGKMIAFFPAEVCQRLEKDAQGVPVRIPLSGETLPEACVVRIFLLRDLESLRVADAATVAVNSSG